MPDRIKGPILVLSVDSHPIFLLGLTSVINSMGNEVQQVGQAMCGTDAEILASTLRPDVILMGLHLSGESGLETSILIKKAFPHVHIIMLSSIESQNEIGAALLTGASGYLLRTTGDTELKGAIFSVMNDEAVFSPSIARSMLGILRQPSRDLKLLTSREVQILQMVAHGATNRTIAQELFLGVRTVETHIQHIFAKLGVASRTAAVTIAIQRELIRIA